ncbi:MAG: DUF86 domain-containing protein [Ruminococcaceae bacterium]|nr:DUF86 domain-containing protein [Oscillospiraceae bacterium]
MTSKDRSIVEHILKWCSYVCEDVELLENSFEQFESNRQFRSSIGMNILQIGELVHKLSDEFKENTKQYVPWNLIYGMRCHFAHGYEKMNNEAIWDVAVNDVPALKRFCEEQLSA